MATSMGPPSSAPSEPQSPPQPEDPSTTSPPSEAPISMKPPMPPPPPKNPNADADTDPIPQPESAELEPKVDGDEEGGRTKSRVDRGHHSRPQAPYIIPPWSAAPCHSYSLEVLKEGLIIDQFDITEKGAYMFGRADLCDFVLENPTVSRFHAVLQFKESGEAYLYDLGSSHGSFVNKNQVKGKVYVELHVGDVLRFGLSTRLYIFQGPTDLMPPETDIKSIKSVKYRLEKQDREASLRRAQAQAALADGISWGMGEDAIEEDEDEVDEITWQTYKGELTEKQDKTRSKVLKRLEKIAHMKKEMDAIRVKDIPQGGLTQGQQTQIARNEQRISQLLEELESLEETLNDSIKESLGARTKGSSYGKKKTATEDDEEFLSDEDDFYDRTKKKRSVNKSQEGEIIETADTLLDKKEVIMKEMEEKTKLLHDEKNKLSEPPAESESGDVLDAFMSGLSSQLKHDTAEQIEKQIATLQTDLDRILYLLKIADPSGEFAKKRQITAEKSNSKEFKDPQISLPEVRKISKPERLIRDPSKKQVTTFNVTAEIAEDNNKPKKFTVEKPQWLGAVTVKDEEKGKSQKQEASVDTPSADGDEFVGYKDRDKILSNKEEETDLENAAPGLIIRKKKVEEPVEESTSGNGMNAEDAVALLLKHKRGYQEADEAENQETEENNKRAKRVLGPAKPSFLNTNNKDYDTWVPPQGQSGDGRTSLNDRLGY